MSQKNLKPILKWAGGKTQLLTDITHAFPDEFGNSINKYAEPFVGGGAVLFYVLSNYKLDSIYISDINAELMNMYSVIRDNAHDLIDILNKYQSEYDTSSKDDRKQYYYDKRYDFNKLILTGESKKGINSAALFIFLNRTCFNGLYRANKQGLFNVPQGQQNNPVICNSDNILSVASALSNVEIVCGDYKKSKSFIDNKTLVYLDPPYRPLKGRDSFISYTELEFDDSCQRELAGYIEDLDAKGAHIILSNSDPKNVDNDDEFFDELYAGYDIQRILAKRKINRNADSRGYITELLIRNY